MRKELTRIVLFCFALLCALSLLTVATISKYHSNVSSVDDATVAIFQTGTYNVTLSLDEMNPGAEKEYTFNITNFSGTSICEVTLEYTINVSNKGHLPLQIVFANASSSRNNIANDIIIDGQNSTSWSLWNKNATKGETGKMAAALATTHTYTMKIVWPEGYTDIRYKDEIDAVTVSVTATQVE